MKVWNIFCRLSLGVVVLLAAGCHKKVPAPPPPPPALQNLIVLLPNEDGTSGSLVVTNAGGSQQLTQPYSGLMVERSDAAPSAPFPVDPSEVQRLFQGTLAVMAAPEARFNLYFLSGGTTLTQESQAELPAVLQAYRERRSTDVTIIGHTDTVGDSQANYELGLERAGRISEMIRALGVDPSHVFTESHGEGDLLVPTKDNVAEPKNRRVEVIVR